MPPETGCAAKQEMVPPFVRPRFIANVTPAFFALSMESKGLLTSVACLTEKDDFAEKISQSCALQP
jgi:hypothetical protein